MMTRRDFVKVGCAAAGAWAISGLVGCSTKTGEEASSAKQGSEDGAGGMSASAGSSSKASETKASSASLTAVVFFSCTGNTEAVADKIAQVTDGTFMRIEPAESYTAQDLDYDSDCRANEEQQVDARPAIAEPAANIAAFDTVYLGYPVWWGKAPRIVLTFLEGADTAGKKIVPFCTSGSSPISGSIDELHAAAPEAEWAEGRRFASGASQQEIDAWIKDDAVA